MRTPALGLLLGVVLSVSPTLRAAYAPPAGFTRAASQFGGDAFAVAPDGKVAVATGSFSGNATITVYPSAAAAQTNASPIVTFPTDAGFKFWGDLTFTDNDTLLFTENFGKRTAYIASVSGASAMPLAPVNAIPNAAGIVKQGGDIYVASAQGPGSNAVFKVSGGSAVALLSGIGVGYLGGIAFDAAGNMLLTDTNDADFSGDAGKLLCYSPALAPLSPIDLAGGNGVHAYDIVLDSDGDIFVSTESTLTRIPFGTTAAEQFGSAFTGGMFGTFISALDFAGSGFAPGSGSGTLWINAVGTDDAATIGITPIPEPASLALLAIAGAFVLRRRRLSAKTIAASLAVVAAAFTAPRAQASQFYATQVVDRVVGAQQQAVFGDPSLALGAPRGGGTTINSLDVYCLGNGGSLTLGFLDNASQGCIVDGPGMDFIVFENTFYQSEDPHRSFAELLFVEVSSDGTNFLRFPPYTSNLNPVNAFGVVDPFKVSNLAGSLPVLANVDENEIDPFDPLAAGGNAFDLFWLRDDPMVTGGFVDLDQIAFVRLIDVIGDGRHHDTFGRPIFDPTGVGIGGADVDALAVIHGTHAPEPTIAAPLCGLAMLLQRRR